VVAVLPVASEDDGGMARSVYLLAKHLRDFGVRPHLVLHRHSPFATWLDAAGIAYEIVPDLIETGLRGRLPDERGWRALARNCTRAPSAIGRLRTIVRQTRADVLYSHGTWSNYLAACTAIGAATPPVVWHVRNDHSAPLARRAGRSLARLGRVQAVIAVSDAAAAPYRGLPGRLEVIYTSVDFSDIDAAMRRPVLRAKLGLDREAILVGFAGRLAAHKGVDVLMEAFRHATSSVASLHLVILGGTSRHATVDEVETLRARAAAWGLTRRIHILGHIQDVEAHLADLDLVSVPSTCRDGCPRTAIEALSLGVPVIASNTGGIPEIVRHGVTGVLVCPGSARELADALVGLAGNALRRREMRAAAAADARRRFDARQATAAVADVLHSVAVRA
jgi:glycosyltransferase involved in cell wall biosynthesis